MGLLLLLPAVDAPFYCWRWPIMSCKAVTIALTLEIVAGPRRLPPETTFSEILQTVQCWILGTGSSCCCCCCRLLPAACCLLPAACCLLPAACRNRATAQERSRLPRRRGLFPTA